MTLTLLPGKDIRETKKKHRVRVDYDTLEKFALETERRLQSCEAELQKWLALVALAAYHADGELVLAAARLGDMMAIGTHLTVEVNPIDYHTTIRLVRDDESDEVGPGSDQAGGDGSDGSAAV